MAGAIISANSHVSPEMVGASPVPAECSLWELLQITFHVIDEALGNVSGRL